ncbi:MAG: NAD-dependent epimerase/dehydratase family protein [Methyloceanibacter sp.]
MSSVTVLVTGGAGYVGAHTCKALSRAGYFPVVVDNLSTGHASFVRWGPLIEADIRDYDAVFSALRSHQVDAVLHFAASAYVGESVADPQKYYDNNVAGSLALLKAMLQAGCLKIVFSSSCTVYGEPDEMPIREQALHVSDLAGAHVASVQRLIQGAPSGAFNLGTGRGYSVKQVLDAIRAEAGERLEVGTGPRRPGDPPILVADAALANAELGFKPHLSDLKTIIGTAWSWHRRAHPKKGTFNGAGARQAL